MVYLGKERGMTMGRIKKSALLLCMGILAVFGSIAAGAKQAPPEFTDRVTLRWQMPEHTEAPLLEQLRELTRGSAQVTVSDPFYAPF